MPRKRFFKKKQFKKRRFRRKRRINTKGHKTRIFGGGNFIQMDKKRNGPLPQKYSCALPYVSTGLTLNPSVGTPIALYVFSMNGLFDPNITSVGHQPLGFDEMMDFYHYYNVIGSKATITLRNIDPSYSLYCGAFIHQSSTPVLDTQTLLENGVGTYSLLGPMAAGNDSNKVTLQVKYSTKKYWGITRQIGEDSFRALKSANPTSQAFLIVWAAGRNAEDTAAAELDLRIDYLTVFTNPEYTLGS